MYEEEIKDNFNLKVLLLNNMNIMLRQETIKIAYN